MGSRRIFLCGIWTCLCLVAVGFAVGAESQPAPQRTVVTGTIESKWILTSQQLQFSVTIANDSEAALEGIQALRIPSHYQIERICTPDCRKFDPSRPAILSLVRPHETITIWGWFHPEQAHRPEKISLVLGWTQSGASNSAAVNLGESEAQARWLYWLGFVVEPIKILLVPVVLLLVGYWVNEQAKMRDSSRADHEKSQAVRAEIWKQMLPTASTYASKYYIPVCAAAAGLVDALVKYVTIKSQPGAPRAELERQARLACFNVLLTESRMHSTRRRTGAFILTDLRAEDLVFGCREHFITAFVDKIGSDLDMKFRACSRLVGFNATFDSFRAKFPADGGGGETAEQTELKSFENMFQAWLDGKLEKVIEAVFYLRGFAAVLEYEVNRPYKYWYSRSRALRLDRPESAEVLIQPVIEGLSPYPTTGIFKLNPPTLRNVIDDIAKKYEVAHADEYLNTALSREEEETETE
jgi:hypothetical protein